MKKSIRRHILVSNLFRLVLGVYLALQFGWIFFDGVVHEFRKPNADMFLGALQGILIGGICLVGAGLGGSALVYLIVPRMEPAARQMRRYGEVAAVAAEIDRQLPAATLLPGHMALTADWLIRFGKLSVFLYKVEDLVLVSRSESKVDAGTQFVLCDIHAREAVLKLDGFEITRIAAALRARVPWAIFEMNAEEWGRWRSQRGVMIAEVKERREAARAAVA